MGFVGDIPFGAGYDMIKDVLVALKNHSKPIPEGQFIKRIEQKLGKKLSNASRNKILAQLEQNGQIIRFTSKTGHKYVKYGGVI